MQNTFDQIDELAVNTVRTLSIEAVQLAALIRLRCKPGRREKLPPIRQQNTWTPGSA